MPAQKCRNRRVRQRESRPPENAPDMPDDCPICFEPLFDERGIAEREVAKIVCIHLVHSDCLVRAGKTLNADGHRYGIGGLGTPRAGCPLCGQPVTLWTEHKKATDFPIFWMHRIQACLEKIGPRNGPIEIDTVKNMLKNDPSLTSQQKSHLDLRGTSDLSNGFLGALTEGNTRIVT